MIKISTLSIKFLSLKSPPSLVTWSVIAPLNSPKKLVRQRSPQPHTMSRLAFLALTPLFYIALSSLIWRLPPMIGFRAHANTIDIWKILGEILLVSHVNNNNNLTLCLYFKCFFGFASVQNVKFNLSLLLRFLLWVFNHSMIRIQRDAKLMSKTSTRRSHVWWKVWWKLIWWHHLWGGLA